MCFHKVVILTQIYSITGSNLLLPKFLYKVELSKRSGWRNLSRVTKTAIPSRYVTPLLKVK